MGTPDFAAEGLKALLGAGHEISLVLTQPDRPRGRHSAPRKSEVRLLAEEHGISVLTPSRLFTDEEAIGRIRELSPELIVVSAFGQLLPKEVLEIPDYGCVNIHASLLPRFRGASPVQWAILSGDKESGVTTMQMDEGLDTGDMLLWREVPIHADTTYGTLHDALMETGASLLVETLERLAAGTLVRTPQTGTSCYAARITRETVAMDWSKKAQELDAFVRGLNPVPYAQTSLDGAVYKIGALRSTGHAASVPSGTIVAADRKAGLIVAAGDEDVEITEIQAPGKKMMEAHAFLNGYTLPVGGRFSS